MEHQVPPFYAQLSHMLWNAHTQTTRNIKNTHAHAHAHIDIDAREQRALFASQSQNSVEYSVPTRKKIVALSPR